MSLKKVTDPAMRKKDGVFGTEHGRMRDSEKSDPRCDARRKDGLGGFRGWKKHRG